MVVCECACRFWESEAVVLAAYTDQLACHISGWLVRSAGLLDPSVCGARQEMRTIWARIRSSDLTPGNFRKTILNSCHLTNDSQGLTNDSQGLTNHFSASDVLERPCSVLTARRISLCRTSLTAVSCS